MKRSQIVTLAGVGLVALASYTWFRTAARAGEFTTLAPVFDGTCTNLGGMPGAEDINIDREAGRIYVASDDRRGTAAGKATRGGVYILPLAGLTEATPRVDATGGQPAAFHPHGTSIFKASDGKVTIMVVNHPKGFKDYSGTTVEVFDQIGEDKLVLRRTVSIPSLTRINDIIATGPDSFYATSESDIPNGSFGEFWNIVTNDDRSGAIWYFDGSAGKKLDAGIGFANSLALSPDGRKLYATGTLSRSLFIYDRDPLTNMIKRSGGALIGSGVDNLDVEPDGRIWVAAHPKTLTFVQHALNAAKGAPSQVLILEPKADGQGGNIDQVYLQGSDSGFSGASVAVRSGDTMVLGSVFEPGIRVCTLPKVWKQSESHPAQRLLDPDRDEMKKEEDKAAGKPKAS